MTGKDLKNASGNNTITLDGKEYEIALDFNAICDLEDKFGSFDAAAKILDGIGADFKKPDAMKNVRFLLYVMLRHTDDEITEREVGKLLTMNEMQSIMNALGEAMNASVGGDGNEKNAESPQEK